CGTASGIARRLPSARFNEFHWTVASLARTCAGSPTKWKGIVVAYTMNRAKSTQTRLLTCWSPRSSMAVAGAKLLPVTEELAQRLFGAAKRQLTPRNLVRVEETGLQALVVA